MATAATFFHFELLTPEKLILGKDMLHVVIPGNDGDIGVLPGHAPLLTTLRPGLVRLGEGDDAEIFVVSGGYAEVLPERATVLANTVIARKDLTTELADRMRSEAAQHLTRLNPEDPAYHAAQQRVEYAEICQELMKKKN